MAKVDRPESVAVGPFTYRVVYKPEPFSSDAAQSLLGESRHLDQELRICASLQPDKLRAVLVHEVLHAVADTLDVDIEERDVSLLATGIFEWMRRNPRFVEWVMEE